MIYRQKYNRLIIIISSLLLFRSESLDILLVEDDSHSKIPSKLEVIIYDLTLCYKMEN